MPILLPVLLFAAAAAAPYDVVIRNGRLVIDQGHHTGAKPGSVLRGAGYGAHAAERSR